MHTTTSSYYPPSHWSRIPWRSRFGFSSSYSHHGGPVAAWLREGRRHTTKVFPICSTSNHHQEVSGPLTLSLFPPPPPAVPAPGELSSCRRAWSWLFPIHDSEAQSRTGRSEEEGALPEKLKKGSWGLRSEHCYVLFESSVVIFLEVLTCLLRSPIAANYTAVSQS